MRAWNIIVPLLPRFALEFFGMTDKIVVLSTCATQEEAEKLARVLLDERLAACVNVIPRIRSYYRWKGAIESADECLLVVKSSRELIGSIGAVLEGALLRGSGTARASRRGRGSELPELASGQPAERFGTALVCDSIQLGLDLSDWKPIPKVSRVCTTFGYLPDMVPPRIIFLAEIRSHGCRPNSWQFEVWAA